MDKKPTAELITLLKEEETAALDNARYYSWKSSAATDEPTQRANEEACSEYRKFASDFKECADRLAELEEQSDNAYRIISGLREDVMQLGGIIEALCSDGDLPEPSPSSKYWHNLAVAKRKSLAKQALQPKKDKPNG